MKYYTLKCRVCGGVWHHSAIDIGELRRHLRVLGWCPVGKHKVEKDGVEEMEVIGWGRSSPYRAAEGVGDHS